MSSPASRIHDANCQLVGDGNMEAIAEFFTTNYVVNFGGSKKSGHNAVRGFVKAMQDAFSELSVDVEILMESGDRISWQRTIRGTQTGSFQGFPATGTEVTWRDMLVSRVEDGRIAEEWVVSDLAEALLRSRKR